MVVKLRYVNKINMKKVLTNKCLNSILLIVVNENIKNILL